MNGRLIGLTVALALACGTAVFADGTADPRIGKLLDKLGIAYTTTTSGNYSIEKDVKGGRKQTVYIMSSTETYGALEIREIWSNAGDFEAEPTSDQMLQLLDDNNTEKIGAWNLEASDDGTNLAYFSIKIPVYLRDKDFSDMIDFAANVGDEMELKLFNTDDN